MNKITLIFDPYDICEINGEIVNSPKTEFQAFEDIDNCLKGNDRPNTIYIIKRNSCNCFDSYKNLNESLNIKHLAPSRELSLKLNRELPIWLDDENICKLNLLSNQEYNLDIDSPEELILDSMIPGITEINKLDLFIIKLLEYSDTQLYKIEELKLWITNRINLLLDDAIPTYIKEHFIDLFTEAEDPYTFLMDWIKKVALYPIRKTTSLQYTSAEIGIIAQFPLIFPLPKEINTQVSNKYLSFIRQKRINNDESLEFVIESVNALWEGLFHELQIWLEMYPNSLNKRLVNKLENLPGYNEDYVKLINKYREPDPISRWESIDNLNQWTSEYASYIKQCFLRYELPNREEDPATGFSSWLKKNYGVIFNHDEFAFYTVSKSIREELSSERSVLFVIIDALAIHLVDDFLHIMNSTFSSSADLSYAFAPIPTTTKICKSAIVTGELPNKAPELSEKQISSSYDLDIKEVSFFSNWNSIKHFQPTKEKRLIIYRENRVDDILHSRSSYDEALVEINSLFANIAKYLQRLINDMNTAQGAEPLLIITGDHGFTFLPNNSHNMIDSNKRYAIKDCSKKKNEHLTIIPKDEFYIENDYHTLIDRSNYNSEDKSNWRIMHGGMLPEEVIIPVVRYFTQSQIVWPQFSTTKMAEYNTGTLHFTLEIQNPHTKNIDIQQIIIKFETHQICLKIGEVKSNTKLNRDIKLEGINNLVYSSIILDIVAIQKYNNHKEEQASQLKVPIQKTLVERTSEQDDFENMFS